jgi:ketopantoate reductase
MSFVLTRVCLDENPDMNKYTGAKPLTCVAVVKNAAETEMKFDFIVCAHKAIQQDAVPADIEAAVDPARSTIVIIQNGVGNEEPFRKAFPSTTIISCVVSRVQFEIGIHDLLTLHYERHGQAPFRQSLDTSSR